MKQQDGIVDRPLRVPMRLPERSGASAFGECDCAPVGTPLPAFAACATGQAVTTAAANAILRSIVVARSQPCFRCAVTSYRMSTII
jgi:hypothetical protein